MKYLFTLTIALLPLTIFGQGSSIRALNGLGTNITLRGQNIIRTNLLVDATGSATISPTNIFEGVWTNGLKVLSIGRNTGLVYFGTNTVHKGNMLAANGSILVDTTNRRLLASDGTQLVKWADTDLNDGFGILALEWGTRTIYNAAGAQVGDWDAGLLRSTVDTVPSIHWTNRKLIDSGEVDALNWEARTTSGAWAFTGASGHFTNSITTSNLTVNGTQTVASMYPTNIISPGQSNGVWGISADGTWVKTNDISTLTATNPAWSGVTLNGGVTIAAGGNVSSGGFTNNSTGFYGNGAGLTNLSGIGGGGTANWNITNITAAFTVVTNFNFIVANTVFSNLTITLPAIADDGWMCVIKNIGTNQMTIAANSGQAIETASSLSVPAQFSARSITKNSTNWWAY